MAQAQSSSGTKSPTFGRNPLPSFYHMKKLLVALFALTTLSLHAASPAYENFDPNIFVRIGNNIYLKTNNVLGVVSTGSGGVVTQAINVTFPVNVYVTNNSIYPAFFNQSILLTNTQSAAVARCFLYQSTNTDMTWEVTDANVFSFNQLTTANSETKQLGAWVFPGGVICYTNRSIVGGGGSSEANVFAYANSGSITYIATNSTGSFNGNITGSAATAATATWATNSSADGLPLVSVAGDYSAGLFNLQAFDRALSYSNQISIVVLGDSIGQDVAFSLWDFFNFSTRFPAQISTLNPALSYPLWWNSAVNTRDIPDLWWASGGVQVLTNTETHFWAGGVGQTIKASGDKMFLWFFGGPTNGTISVSNSTDNVTWTRVVSIDESALSRGLYYTNVAISSNAYFLKVASVSGYAQYLAAGVENSVLKSTKIHCIPAAGKEYGDFLAMGTNNIATLFTNLKPDLIVWHQIKRVSSRTNMPSIKFLYDAYATNASRVHSVGQATLLGDSGDTDPRLEGLCEREIALTNGWGYLDLWTPYSNTNRNKALGFAQPGVDEIHFNKIGRKSVSENWMQKMHLVERLNSTTNFVGGGYVSGNLPVSGNLTVSGFAKIIDPVGGTTVITNAGAGVTAITMQDNVVLKGFSSGTTVLNGTAGIQLGLANRGDGFGGVDGQIYASGGLNLWPSGGGGHNADDPGQGGIVINGGFTNYSTTKPSHFFGPLINTNSHANIRTNTAQYDSLTNDFVLGTRYTNVVRRSFISASFQLTAAVAGTAAVTLKVEQSGVTNSLAVSAGPLTSLVTIEPLALPVGPSAVYTFSDTSSGSGASVAIVAGTSSRIDQ